MHRKAKPDGYELECGFDESNRWSPKYLNTSNINAGIFLYKLHGSIDWMRDSSTGELTRYDSQMKMLNNFRDRRKTSVCRSISI
jgi:hypothetical protein